MARSIGRNFSVYSQEQYEAGRAAFDAGESVTTGFDETQSWRNGWLDALADKIDASDRRAHGQEG